MESTTSASSNPLNPLTIVERMLAARAEFKAAGRQDEVFYVSPAFADGFALAKHTDQKPGSVIGGSIWGVPIVIEPNQVESFIIAEARRGAINHH